MRNFRQAGTRGFPAVQCRVRDTAFELHELARAVAGEQPSVVWLDSARRHPVTGRFSVLGWDPWLVVSARGATLTLTMNRTTRRLHGNPFALLRRVLRQYAAPHSPLLPPIGCGLIGGFSYELNRWVERLPGPKPIAYRLPELLLFGMRKLVVVDHARRKSWCVGMAEPHQPEAAARRQAHANLEAVEDLLTRCASAPAESSGPGSVPTIEPTMSQSEFETMVHEAKAFIAAGEIFQANLSQQFLAAPVASPWTLYQTLRRVNPSPFACFLQTPEFAVVSCSPERLVAVRNDVAMARPIAGTRPRGATPADDLLNSLELLLSDKERAEHIMLVDLARNDLGRVCQFGSVKADTLMTLEDYSHVMHIVSNIQGRLRRQVEPVDVVRAMFPGGTITGCPKVRCMQIIRELEPVGRGWYTGSLGYLGSDGTMDLNILIRTMIVQDGRAWLHVGAGIVADSQPDREYGETLAKAEALFNALRLAAATPGMSHAVAR